MNTVRTSSRWGVLLPTFDPLGLGTPPLAAAARLAEELGFDALWAGDHLLSPAPVLDALCALSAAAAVTTRVELGTSVLLLGLRQPAWAAKQLATIDALAPGRLRLGLGVGGEYPDEFTAVGALRERRGRQLDELLAILPQLLRGAAVEHPGPLAPVHVPGLRPAVGTLPPISIGGRSDAALQRAARSGDQWLGMWHDAAAIHGARSRLAELAAQHGRPAPSVGLLVLVNVDEDLDAARRDAEASIAGQYRMPLRIVDRWTAYGPAEQVARQLGDYRRAGVDEFVLMPVGRDPIAQYHRFAAVREIVDRVSA